MSGRARREEAGCRAPGAEHTLVLRGEIDLLTAPSISACLDQVTGIPQVSLTLDLRPVTFLDCSGLSVLDRARRRVRDSGGHLRLEIDSPRILRLLRLTGLDTAFDIHTCLPRTRQAS
jgi:anti-sigma B factor antagonist